MRTLVISDVHGNLAALRAVLDAEPWDELVCLGDLVGYGPRPAACVDLVREAGAVLVQGNHDRAVTEAVLPRCHPAFSSLAEPTLRLARADLGPEELGFLRGLPRWSFLDRDGFRGLLVHAAPSDPLYRYLGPEDPAWQTEADRADADLFLVGHTHLQFLVRVGEVTIVNPGSVGQPKDGRPEAAYALLEDGEIALRRARYPIEDTVRALAIRGVPPEPRRLLTEILRTGRVPALLRA